MTKRSQRGFLKFLKTWAHDDDHDGDDRDDVSTNGDSNDHSNQIMCVTLTVAMNTVTQ